MIAAFQFRPEMCHSKKTPGMTGILKAWWFGGVEVTLFLFREGVGYF